MIPVHLYERGGSQAQRPTWSQAVEEDLYALFAPLGEILELYVLRNNQTGRSRGCAFVTFSSRHLAEGAISALNGCQVTTGKALVVKFADRVPL